MPVSDSEEEPRQAPPRPRRTLPNILLTGTPGTGKTTTADMVLSLASPAGLLRTHIDLPLFIKTHRLHDLERDETWDTLLFDEEEVVDALEPMLGGPEGGVLVDSHSCDFFPERWFDLVVVLTTSTPQLYDRLMARGYTERKVQENMECEVMMVCVTEARESYAPEVVVTLPSDGLEDMESNVERIVAWIEAYLAQGKAAAAAA